MTRIFLADDAEKIITRIGDCLKITFSMLYLSANHSNPTPDPSPTREGSGVLIHIKGLLLADRLYLVSKNKVPSLFGEGVGGGVQFPGENNLQTFLNRL
jgi:hypothetical protein